MCQWNSDFPSCPTTIIKLKAKLGWKAAETLMQDATRSEKTNGDAGAPPLQMDAAAVSGPSELGETSALLPRRGAHPG